jgi:organic radical activating enzyme
MGLDLPTDYGNLSFYITNVCNLNCTDCSYLNNYPVKGHQRWADYEKECIAWSKRIDPALIFILGGEPMANPDFLLWTHGIAKLWPHAEIRINTNGTYFHRWPTMYDELLQYNGRVNLSISSHNEDHKEKEFNNIRTFLKGEIKELTKGIFQTWRWKKVYNDIKDSSWPDIHSLDEYYALSEDIRNEIENVHSVHIENYITDYDEPVKDWTSFVDENNMRVGWARWDEFRSSAITFNPDNQIMTLYNNDPVEAVRSCHGGECSHVKDGKWYKCEVMGVLPDLIDQGFPIDINEDDKELILAYEPALPSWSDEKLLEFMNGLINKDPIPQCKFCPTAKDKVVTKIHATTSKPKIVKWNITEK